MKRINVIGTTGSGKSKFSKALAQRMDYRYIQMDEFFWKPNWVEATDEEFAQSLRHFLLEECWVLDGNYSQTNEIKWEKTDTIIWIDYSYFRTLLQLCKRTVARAVSKKELWEGTGNKESFRQTFMSKDSILVWFFKSYGKNRSRYEELISSPKLKHVKFIRLRSPGESRIFLENINA